VVPIFPNGESCLRLGVETHENWLEQHRYLNMDDLREHKRRHCAVLPDPDPFSLAPCSLGQGRFAPAPPPFAAASLDCRRARRSA